ncbi:molybdenum cofactor biosynthesis protein MoaE [Herbiconiux sp. UC225_62]|uniref:molybdenum cofactor biosynthesis protein MoaE n=1 Tax=Herbiconiux sp. UC225_62 TaxID=3350168 RepID=UPI0036D3B569
MPDTTDIGGDPGKTRDVDAQEAPAAESDRVVFARVAESAISVEECAAAVEGAASGAVVTFAGVVRDHDEGRGVIALSYSAHPSASAVIQEVALDVARAHPAVTVAVAHRVGDLGIGDVALACAVASAHRAEAFAACAALVDEVKAKVPIWKEQSFDDGTSEWVASIG